MFELTQIFIIVNKKKFTIRVPLGQLTESQCICYEIVHERHRKKKNPQ